MAVISNYYPAKLRDAIEENTVQRGTPVQSPFTLPLESHGSLSFLNLNEVRVE